MAKFFKVGGCVRDEWIERIHGIKKKKGDIDYSVVAKSYSDMIAEIKKLGGTIYIEKEEFLTVRAGVPSMGACDFVLCRKDGIYKDGRRPETVEPGTIYDDLARRDFTMNAIAKAENGQFIDPYNGRLAIKACMIECVGDPVERFSEDGLRILRALRFSVTLGFSISYKTQQAMTTYSALNALRGVSIERIREELNKMFMHNTVQSLILVQAHPQIFDICFGQTNQLKLQPTLKKG